MRPIIACHDPDEEVGREEGPEDHDLRDDEQQHPEERGVDARRPVGLGRTVVVVVVPVVVDVGGGSGHYASAFARDSMCSTGTLVAPRTRSTSLSATHCDVPS